MDSLVARRARQNAHNVVPGESVSVIERLQKRVAGSRCGLRKSGYDLVDTAESITAIKDDDNFTGLTCLPDTVAPRRGEGKTNDAP